MCGRGRARIATSIAVPCVPRSHTVAPSPARVDAQGPALAAALESLVLYLALSPWDNEVSDEMHRLKGDARLEAVPAFRALVVQVGAGSGCSLGACSHLLLLLLHPCS